MDYIIQAIKENNKSELKFHLIRSREPLRDKYNKTPLHYAVEEKRLHLIPTIMSFCPDSLNHRDCRGRTPLHYAAELEDMTIFDKLYNYGASTAIEDNQGITPYQIVRDYVPRDVTIAF